MVVSLHAGREAVRAYVAEQAALGLAHVVSLLKADRAEMIKLIGDLSLAEGNARHGDDQWSIGDALAHLNSSFPRSLERIRTLASGRAFENPLTAAGTLPPAEAAAFGAARPTFEEGSQAVIDLLERTDAEASRELTSDHAMFGPFDWLEWAVYSHHVHTHDHLGQIRALRESLGR